MLILKHCNIAILFPPAVGLDFQLERGDRVKEELGKNDTRIRSNFLSIVLPPPGNECNP